VTTDPALALGSPAPVRFTKPRRVVSRPLVLVPSEPVPAGIERQRARKLVGAAEAARVDGCEVVELEAFEQALALVVEAASAAFRAQEGWVDGVRAGLVALLEVFDEEPALARYLVVGSAQAGGAVLARRNEVLDRVAVLLDDERAPARTYPPPLTAHAVASGVLGVLYARLSEPEPGVLAELARSLMSFVVLPFLGARAARRELRRPVETAPSPAVGLDVVQDPGRRLNHHREIEVLGVLAGESGLSNREVALRVAITDRGHISRLMARLARLGLIENMPRPGGLAGVKAWRLTGSGEQLHVEVLREAAAPGPGVVLDLPEEFEGRLDFWAVCVLRAVGEQPWLTGSEVAARAGVNDPAHISRLLAHLAGMGLVDSAREAHRKGTPKVWRITDSGRELDNTIGLETPKRPRSVALDLMWESGGRLSEPAISVLRTIGGEPGLSNGEIAQRVGITDANSTSQLLARLTRRGLIANSRDGGRDNVWVFTAAGTALQDALRQETPAPVSRTVAFDVLSEAGGRLNHRVVSVLQAIAAEPRLSNKEVAERVGVESKAHTSKLLARLARFGLIENQVLDAAPFEANAWRLTASGRHLEATIRHEGQSATPRAPGDGQGMTSTMEPA
jgi:DNA-binding MarR family transcriptional regulator